jgi:ParB-like chromosome segregation protein Spo0J
MAEFHEFADTDVRSPQVSQTAHPRDIPSSSADYSVKITHPRCRIVPWRVGKLRPHPSYARLDMKVPASRLNALLEMGEDAFAFPLTVTSDGIVIDGYARLEIARLQKRATVECIEYDISEKEALRRLLLCHRQSAGMAPFNRIILALSLESVLREKARLHQQAGGKNKGSSKLTEAETVDVRRELAASAAVSVGTFSHVKQLLRTVDPSVRQALCNGEIKIDRAWRWSKESLSCQRESLRRYRRHRGMERVAEKLVARQLKKLKSEQLPATKWKNATSSEVVSRLAALRPDTLESVDVFFIKAPGPWIALSEDIAQRLGFQEEVLSCP